MRLFLLVFLLFPILNAFSQTSAEDSAHVIETVFNARLEYKDGYHIGGLVMYIPQDIAMQCDNKKIRISERISHHTELPEEKWHKKGTGIVIQCDCETIYKVAAKEDTLERLVMRATYARVYSIFLWDDKKNEWNVVYNP